MTSKKSVKKVLSPKEVERLLGVLKVRFEKNSKRHPGVTWVAVEARLKKNPATCWTLAQMEATGGEPDVIAQNKKTGEITFCDCSAESPSGRRSVCFDREAQTTRKEFAPENNAMDMAEAMGIEMLTEEQYRALQTLGPCDEKTSSWIQTPADIRKKGGALFADYRYGHVFIYHNGASSYYAARGFRGTCTV